MMIFWDFNVLHDDVKSSVTVFNQKRYFLLLG